MKKLYILLFFSIQTIFAQEYSVEKSIFSAQAGILGFWVNNESRLSNQFTLKSEIGLDVFSTVDPDDNNDFNSLVPVIILEPRWYYNLEKRGRKGRNIYNNGGNFIALTTSFHSDWFVISGKNNVYVNDQLLLVPKWGIKRNIGNSNFNYELGAGLGYNFILSKKYPSDDGSEVFLDLHARIGYTFKSSHKRQ